MTDNDVNNRVLVDCQSFSVINSSFIALSDQLIGVLHKIGKTYINKTHEWNNYDEESKPPDQNRRAAYYKQTDYVDLEIPHRDTKLPFTVLWSELRRPRDPTDMRIMYKNTNCIVN